MLGPDRLFAGGLLAPALVTFFTFPPSFLFVPVGAPFIETTHGALRLTAPPAGITAAIVGVIVNVAVFFAAHVFWPEGYGGRFEAVSAAIGAWRRSWRCGGSRQASSRSSPHARPPASR